MGDNCCRSCLGFLLKFLNFLHAFFGVSLAVYAVWVLNHWIRNGGTLDLNKLSDLWFVGALMGTGAIICLTVLTGYVAAEIRSGCCLCFYSFIAIVLIIAEAALAGGVISNKNWQEYLPNDPTGELKTLLAFIEENEDIFKWIGLSLVAIQGMSVFLALSLKAALPRRRLDYDSDEDFVVIRRPLLIPQVAQSYSSSSMDGKGFHSDVWSSRMRQKYGLNQNEYTFNPADSKV
ncbi:hypothetical protein LUZ61_020728 [Rhynchospora tenuis]|uniref:Tetraspanin-18 n=1 Tax=Rhynchospora tenuis TaxID=198213 RepID=A0AAD6EP32_9POAL|nr:hypothetical protein LUZ61_020728 [Rhynchospora tenuis]